MLRLEIVTPERRVLDETVDSVTVPTASGEAGILPNHAPLISALKPGVLSYFVKGVIDRMVVSAGFVEVSDNNVSVLVDFAETAAEIDVEAARTEREAAERELVAAGPSTLDDTEAIREKIDASTARIHLAAAAK